MSTQISRKDGKSVPAFVSKTNTDKPCVIVIQEWWGVNEQMQKRALKFEHAGFRTILPDLYHGKSAAIGELNEAKHLFQNLNWEEALLDLEACVDYALSTGSKKVGITGYCMGGALALAAASKFSNVSAVAPFYGLPNPEHYDLSNIACPVQGHFAEIDDWVSVERVNKELKQKVKTEQEIYEYSGAHHAFTNEARPEVFNHKATELSLDRTLVFFAKHLF